MQFRAFSTLRSVSCSTWNKVAFGGIIWRSLAKTMLSGSGYKRSAPFHCFQKVCSRDKYKYNHHIMFMFMMIIMFHFFSALAQAAWWLLLHNPPLAPPGWVPPPDYDRWPSQELQRFAQYMEGTWFRRFPMHLWCHWSSGPDRTTNAAEAYHSVLSKWAIFSNLPSY